MRTRTEDQPNVTGKSPAAASDAPARGNSARVARTRGRILDAVITSLDEVGYSECSINRVQTLAGVSRGALTHHFPNKEEIMVQTLEHLLAPVRGPSAPGDEARLLHPSPDSLDLQDQLHQLWRRVLIHPRRPRPDGNPGGRPHRHRPQRPHHPPALGL
ncbi:TetR/AcrR family transcriptional regulator [Pseudophaeobacter leonis]|uniref:TetR/AcrR family transcriptional regulator n=1 Tax=Pseudophaeobacter leonis TaxID=1144477 RepID=UPI001F4D5C5A|nr:TetR/AcrR family transcriptional regulator [Pseudophaeobacter leonis]